MSDKEKDIKEGKDYYVDMPGENQMKYHFCEGPCRAIVSKELAEDFARSFNLKRKQREDDDLIEMLKGDEARLQLPFASREETPGSTIESK